MNRGDLTDTQWARLQPLLPPQCPPKGSTGGRPRNDDRPIINGILWILRTGAPWPDLPARYGPPSTVSTRLYRWKKAGIWDRLFAAVQAEAREGLERWKKRHKAVVKYLEPLDVLVDSMRGRSTTWTRIRINLQHVPEGKRPKQEPLEVDYDPWEGVEWPEGAERPMARKRQSKG